MSEKLNRPSASLIKLRTRPSAETLSTISSLRSSAGHRTWRLKDFIAAKVPAEKSGVSDTAKSWSERPRIKLKEISPRRTSRWRFF